MSTTENGGHIRPQAYELEEILLGNQMLEKEICALRSLIQEVDEKLYKLAHRNIKKGLVPISDETLEAVLPASRRMD